MLNTDIIFKISAPVQHWDHHVKDGYKRRYDQHEPTKSKSFWDGTRSYGIAEELEKQSSTQGYGASGRNLSLGSKSGLFFS
jgi:hypothetical protein